MMSIYQIKVQNYLQNPLQALIPQEKDANLAIKKITNFIKKYFKRSGFKKAIIGLSGGIDSTLSAYLSCLALGNKNVYGVLIPSKFTSKFHIETALEICQELKIDHNNFELMQREFDRIAQSIEKIGEFSKDENLQRLKYGNIQARLRMIILRDLAKKHEGLVIGTTNRTELLLGYATIAGDGLGGIDIEPIASLFKTTEKEISRYLGIPKKIIQQKATAELWSGQTDEAELGLSYELIDQILLGLKLKLNDDQIMKAISRKAVTRFEIEKIKKQILNNRYKNSIAKTVKL